MREVKHLVLGLGVALLLAGAAEAQQFRRGAGLVGPAMLVQNESVQQELKLSEDQVGKVKEFGQKLREKFQDEFAQLRQLEQKERAQKGQELMKKVEAEGAKALKELLEPGQLKRLHQITLQQRGSQAFLDPAVQKSLKLNDEQRDKIRTVGEEASKELREVFRNAQGNLEEAQKKFRELRQSSMEKALAVLTDEQKKSWKEMTGEPFEVKFGRRPQE
jgi:hypothetical protein